MNFFENMMQSDMANLDKLTPKKQYICRVSYKGIPRNDIVEINIGKHQVYVKHNNMMYCANEFILEQHFERLGE